MEELEIMEQRTILTSLAAGSGVSNDIQLLDHIDIEKDGSSSSDEEYRRVPPEYAQYDEEWERDFNSSSDSEDYEDDEDDELPADTPEMQPVRAFIPLEIWLEIFAFSMPTWLAQARRVSKAFKSLIDSEKIWKRSRQHWFPDYPKPEFGLTEMQMWELRLTVNCTVCGAKHRNDLVLFWQFKVKCCRNCLREKFIPYHRLLQRKNFEMEWEGYLVHGYFLPETYYYGHGTKFNWRTYLLEDVKSLEAKMKSPEGQAWVKINADMLEEKVLIALETSGELEAFESEVEREITEEDYRLRVERGEDIVRRCSLLSPPLETKALRHIYAYKVAISIPCPLTDKSWNTLREKLEAGRVEAEEIARREEEEQKRRKRLEEEERAMLEELLYIWEPTKSRLEEYVDEFLSKNGGMVNKGFESTFVIQALRYARKKWSEIEEYKGKQLPLGMIPHLMETKLAGIRNGQTNVFSCMLCGKSKTFTIEGLLSHLLSPRHKGDKRLKSVMKLVDGFPLKACRSSMGFYPAVIIAERGHYIQWLDNFPMCALGPVFRPLSERGSSNPSPHTIQLERSSLTEAPHGQISAPAIEASPLSLRRIRDIMEKELFRTTNPRMPIPIRLFLWFRLSTNSYIREHGSLPGIMGFVVAASTLRQDKISDIFGTPKCGACSIWYNRGKDGNKQSFNWGTLGDHFVSGHRKLRRNWSEKLVKVPTAQEVIAAMVGMDAGMRERLIELLLEADSKLTLEVLNLEGQNTEIFGNGSNGDDSDVESSCA